jgi:hypothetical protein
VLSIRYTTVQASYRGVPTGGLTAFALVSPLVEPPAGIEPATPSLPWNHQEPLYGPPFPPVTFDRKCQS